MSLEEYLIEHFSSKSIATYTNRINNYMSYNHEHKKGDLQDILSYLKVLRKQGKHTHTSCLTLGYETRNNGGRPGACANEENIQKEQ